jgi:glycosyltransferase involved in cell wall biosynthesis
MLKEKKIAIIFTASILGGHELMSVAHIKKFHNKGFSISCYLPSDNKKLISLLIDAGVHYEIHSVHHKKMEIIHSFFNPMHIIKSVLLLRKLNQEHDYIIIIQGDIELGSGFLNGGRLLGLDNVISYIPYAHSFKKMGSKLAILKDYLAQFAYRNCNNYITICTDFYSELKKKNIIANVKVLKNFVKIPPCEEVRGIGYEFISEPRKLKILMAGRVFFRQKGQDILIEAVRDIDFSIDLIVIGDGPDLNNLKCMVSGLGDNINVEFLGWKKNVWDYSQSVDLIIIPSNYEGVPLIMLEALKRHVPIIAPARDGMLDYLQEESLYFVNEGESEVYKLREKIKEFISARKCQ